MDIGEGCTTEMAACQLYFGHRYPGRASCRSLSFSAGRWGTGPEGLDLATNVITRLEIREWPLTASL